MRFITLTLLTDKDKKIIINVDMIGALSVEGVKTRVGHLCHNNGGYPVSESPEKIIQLIKESKHI